MPKKQVLVCPPDFYDVIYDINPWMNATKSSKRAVNCENARVQWNALCDTLRAHEIECLEMLPQKGLPDLVFTANAGLVHPTERKVLLSNFRHSERRPEMKYYEQWFLDHDYAVSKIKNKDSSFFEGAGDALWCGSTLVIGYGWRTNEKGARQAADFVGGDVAFVKLVNPNFYHLDTCFTEKLNDRVCLYYSNAFDAESQKRIERLPAEEIISVCRKDAERFVCNAIPAVQKTDNENQAVVITSESTPQLRQSILESEFDVRMISVNISEFLKAGGGARCLVLFV